MDHALTASASPRGGVLQMTSFDILRHGCAAHCGPVFRRPMRPFCTLGIYRVICKDDKMAVNEEDFETDSEGETSRRGRKEEGTRLCNICHKDRDAVLRQLRASAVFGSRPNTSSPCVCGLHLLHSLVCLVCVHSRFLIDSHH